jgi:hypothetical protein
VVSYLALIKGKRLTISPLSLYIYPLFYSSVPYQQGFWPRCKL